MATRRERVVLELEDNFTAGAARAAAATAVLKRELDGLNGSSSGLDKTAASAKTVGKEIDGAGKSTERTTKKVKEFTLETAIAAERTARLQKGLRDQAKAAVDAEQGIRRLSDEAVKGSSEIDKYSGRLRLLADVALVLGPAAIVAGAGLAGMGVSAGVAGLALYGLGDALTALNVYQLDPTEANLKKLNAEMAKAGPAGREFVLFLDSLGPKLSDLQMVARAGFLPGLQQGIESLMTRFPEVRSIVADLAAELGDLAAKGGEWLAGPGFEQFQEFLAYARSQGPAVADFARSLAETLVGIAKAAAPVGAVTLPILTKLLDIIAAIANSPLGTPLMAAASAYSAYSLAAMVATKATEKFGAESAVARAGMAGLTSSIIGVAIAIPVLSSVYDKLYSIGQTNGDIEKLVGNAGKLKDFGADIQYTNRGGVHGFLDKYNPDRLVKLGGYDSAKEGIQETDKALAQMVASGHADEAEKAFAKIAAAAKDQGASLDNINKSFPAYTAAAAGAATATGAYGNAANDATEATRTWVQQVKAASDAMQDQRSAALGAFDAVTQYGQALAAAKSAADKGKRGIDANTAAGRENRQALSQLAAAWNNQSDAVRNNSDKFRKARRDFIETATAMGVPQAAARRLARQLLEIPDSRVVKVSAETEQARSALAAIIAQAQSVPRTIRTDYIVNQINRVSKIVAGGGGAGGAHPAGADGMTVPGQRHPYGDKVLAYLAPGEEVITNRRGEADQFRRDRAAGRIPHYANGGPVGNPHSQLFGLGTKAYSDAEIGGRISNLTVRQIRALGHAFDDLNKKQLRHLAKAFDRATDLQEKQTSAAKDALDAVHSRRTDLAGGVTSGLTRNLWESKSGAFYSQFAAGSIGAANAQLHAQIAESAEFTRLESALARRGVTGPALQEILSHGGIGALRMAAASSNSDLRTYQRLYGQAQSGSTRAGQVAGTLVYGAQEARALAAFKAQSAELRAIKVEIRALRREQQSNAEHVGAAAGHAVNNAASAGHRRRR